MMQVIIDTSWEVNSSLALIFDSLSAANLAVGERFPSSCAKRIDVQLYCTRGIVKNEWMAADYVALENNDATVVVKKLVKSALKDLFQRLGLVVTVME